MWQVNNLLIYLFILKTVLAFFYPFYELCYYFFCAYLNFVYRLEPNPIYFNLRISVFSSKNPANVKSRSYKKVLARIEIQGNASCVRVHGRMCARRRVCVLSLNMPIIGEQLSCHVCVQYQQESFRNQRAITNPVNTRPSRPTRVPLLALQACSNNFSI